MPNKSPVYIPKSRLHPRRLRVLMCSLLLPALLMSAVDRHVLAQTPADPAAARAVERIQQEEQDRQRQQFLRDRQAPRPPAEINVQPAPVAPTRDGGGCVNVTTIVINGAANLPDAERARIQNRFGGRCLKVGDIEALLADLTAVYIQRGFVTTRAYVQQQNTQNGTLEILVVEGVVEKISIDSDVRHNIAVGNVFPGLVGKPLNIRDFEQGLEQINRLSSNNATLDIQPGSSPGSSIVVIRNTPSSGWNVHLSADNHGSESTGRDQASVGVSVDNPLGFGDFISLTHRRTVPADSVRKEAISDTVSYLLPFGYNTISFGASKSRYVTTLTTAGGQQLKANGDSRNAFLGIDRVVFRDRSSRANLSALVSNKTANNYLAGQFLEVSSRTLSVLDLDAAYTSAALGGVFGGILGYSRGLNVWNAQADPDNLPDGVPKAQFEKMRYSGYFVLPFAVAGRDASFTTQFSGQYARDTLFGSEQILIGGIYSVRGFDTLSLSGDSGFTLRNDLSMRLPFDSGFAGTAVLKPYVAFDYGRVSSKEGHPGGYLAGFACGFSMALGKMNLDIFNARPVAVSEGLKKEQDHTYVQLRFSI